MSIGYEEVYNKYPVEQIIKEEPELAASMMRYFHEAARTKCDTEKALLKQENAELNQKYQDLAAEYCLITETHWQLCNVHYDNIEDFECRTTIRGLRGILAEHEKTIIELKADNKLLEQRINELEYQLAKLKGEEDWF